MRIIMEKGISQPHVIMQMLPIRQGKVLLSELAKTFFGLLVRERKLSQKG